MIGETEQREIVVWDPVLRLLHWWNACMLIVQFATGILFMFTERDLDHGYGNLEIVHAFGGYAFAAGLMTRILWLLVGPETASWRELVPLTQRQRQLLAATLSSYLRGRHPTPVWFGHNPLAALAYLAFFFVAAVQVVLGVTLLNTSAAERETLAALELHEIGFFLLIAYVVAHLSAVAVHQLIERRALVQAMLTGRKRFSPADLQSLEGLPGFDREANQ